MASWRHFKPNRKHDVRVLAAVSLLAAAMTAGAVVSSTSSSHRAGLAQFHLTPSQQEAAKLSTAYPLNIPPAKRSVVQTVQARLMYPAELLLSGSLPPLPAEFANSKNLTPLQKALTRIALTIPTLGWSTGGSAAPDMPSLWTTSGPSLSSFVVSLKTGPKQCWLERVQGASVSFGYSTNNPDCLPNLAPQSGWKSSWSELPDPPAVYSSPALLGLHPQPFVTTPTTTK